MARAIGKSRLLLVAQSVMFTALLRLKDSPVSRYKFGLTRQNVRPLRILRVCAFIGDNPRVRLILRLHVGSSQLLRLTPFPRVNQ